MDRRRGRGPMPARRGAMWIKQLIESRGRLMLAACAVLALAAAAAFATDRGNSQSVARSRHASQRAIGSVDPSPTPGARPAPIVYRPQGLPRGKPVPLVIALHASGGSPAGFESRAGWNAIAVQHHFVVAYLGSAAPAWKDPSNVAYIRAMIGRISAAENIDPRRVYVTGFSAGGYISYFAGCRLGGKVAAVAPVSAGMLPQPCHPARPVSELTIIGTMDILPLTGPARFPAPASVAVLWRRIDHCPARSAVVQVGPVRQQTWSGCARGSAVGLYIIRGGHHVYPGAVGLPVGDVDAGYGASKAIWAFFAAHPAARG